MRKKSKNRKSARVQRKKANSLGSRKSSMRKFASVFGNQHMLKKFSSIQKQEEESEDTQEKPIQAQLGDDQEKKKSNLTEGEEKERQEKSEVQKQEDEEAETQEKGDIQTQEEEEAPDETEQEKPEIQREPEEEEDTEEVEQEKRMSPVQRQDDEESADDETQAKESGASKGSKSSIGSSLQKARGGGVPLEGKVQSEMESKIGADFSNVRVHTGSNSVQMNKSLKSKAFTNRSDIHFNSGQFNPGSASGKHLLAHELTHVVQQKTVPDLQRKLKDDKTRNFYEVEADRTADKVVSGSGAVARITPGRGNSFSKSSGTQLKQPGTKQAKVEGPVVQMGLFSKAKKLAKKARKKATALAAKTKKKAAELAATAKKKAKELAAIAKKKAAEAAAKLKEKTASKIKAVTKPVVKAVVAATNAKNNAVKFTRKAKNIFKIKKGFKIKDPVGKARSFFKKSRKKTKDLFRKATKAAKKRIKKELRKLANKILGKPMVKLLLTIGFKITKGLIKQMKRVRKAYNTIFGSIKKGVTWFKNLLINFGANALRLAWRWIRRAPKRLWKVIKIVGSIFGEGFLLVFGWMPVLFTRGPVAMFKWIWKHISSTVFKFVQLIFALMDLFGEAEIIEFKIVVLSLGTRKLRADEKAAGRLIVGEKHMDYNAVRVGNSPWLLKIFPAGGITINHLLIMPKDVKLNVVVHELVHVKQFNIIGSLYAPQALVAQHITDGYEYGEMAGLRKHRNYGHFNREQQAKIAQDYYLTTVKGSGDLHPLSTSFDPATGTTDKAIADSHIDQLKAGKIG